MSWTQDSGLRLPGGFICAAAMLCSAQAQTFLAPVEAGSGTQPPAPWQQVLLPEQKLPVTLFERVKLEDGGAALRITAPASYGNWMHVLPKLSAGRLAWRWRVDEALPAADLRVKAGDDAALKVCASFDLPLSALPFAQRQLLRLARATSGEAIPSAVLCYVWDARLPAGTVLPNAYTPLMRWWVLGGPPLGRWASVQRDLAADFRQAFADWWRPEGDGAGAPAVTSVLIGADADSTGGRSVAYLQALAMQP